MRPNDNPDTQVYWEAARQNRLLYQQCTACTRVVFHPRAVCPSCLSDQLDWKQSAGVGVIYSYSVQHVSLDKSRAGVNPRIFGIVALSEGYHMFAEIRADEGNIDIGTPVRVFFEQVADRLTLPKFGLYASNAS